MSSDLDVIEIPHDDPQDYTKDCANSEQTSGSYPGEFDTISVKSVDLGPDGTIIWGRAYWSVAGARGVPSRRFLWPGTKAVMANEKKRAQIRRRLLLESTSTSSSKASSSKRKLPIEDPSSSTPKRLRTTPAAINRYSPPSPLPQNPRHDPLLTTLIDNTTSPLLRTTTFFYESRP